MNGPRVSRLRGIALGGQGITDAEQFYTEGWGLEVVAREDDAVYLRANGPEHHVLSLHDRKAKGIVHVHFAAQDEDALHRLHDHLKAQDATIVTPLGAVASPGGGIGFEVLDPDNRVLRITASVELYPEPLDRRDIPWKITHVVLNTPQLEACLAFYRDCLGFKVSDWSENQMVFIRCNADHHSISFNRAEHPSLNHIAFEMESIDDEMRAVGRLKTHKTEVAWGIGRHGPGNNVFAYFTDPNDFVIEYTTEVQQIDEATHEPQVWKRVPHLMDRWGTAGPPSTDIRKAMAGVPDQGYQGPAESR